MSWRDQHRERLATAEEALGVESLRQRVEELLAVAHPDFRAPLRTEARRLYSC